MRTVILIFLLVWSFLGHAQATRVTLTGDDAVKLMQIFRDVAQNSSIVNPVTGGVIHMFMHFRPGIGAFTLDCVEKNPGMSPVRSCQLSFDPIRSDAMVLIRILAPSQLEVIFSDPDTNKKIQNNLPGGEFFSQTKAADGMSPRLIMGCLAPSVCRLTVMTN